MSQGNKFVYIAIGLITGLAFALLFLIWAVPEFRSPFSYEMERTDTYTNEHTSAHDSADNEHRNEPKWWNWTRRFVAAEDTLAQWIMASFGVAATLISYKAVILVGNSLDLNRRATEAAEDAVTVSREIGQAEVRAYITIEKAVFEADPLSTSATLWIKNVGQSPTKRCRVTGKFRMVDPFSKLGNISYIYASFDKTGECGVIPVGKDDSILLLWLWNEVCLDAEKYDKFLSKNVYFDIGCKVEWIDVFDEKQEFYFFLDGFIDGSEITKSRGSRRRTGDMKVSSIMFGTRDIDESRNEMDKRKNDDT